MRNLIVCTLLVFVSLFASCSTMLEKAAVNNDVEMAKQALAKGEKIEDQKFVGLTAARWGSIAFLEFLLQPLVIHGHQHRGDYVQVGKSPASFEQP